jgi:hypothetical protein
MIFYLKQLFESVIRDRQDDMEQKNKKDDEGEDL